MSGLRTHCCTPSARMSAMYSNTTAITSSACKWPNSVSSTCAASGAAVQSQSRGRTVAENEHEVLRSASRASNGFGTPDPGRGSSPPEHAKKVRIHPNRL
eukprot:2567361-Pyramimonas_sp.AAC.2